MFWKTDFTCRQAVRRHPWRHRRGFSIIELLIVIAILISLGAIAALAYKTYMTSVKIDLSVNQMLRIEDRTKTDFELTLNGVDTGLRVPGADQPITSESTCRDFVTAIKERLKPYKNPFDRSPAVTYSSYSNLHHKEGKVRVTCYKLFHHGTVNGADCPFARRPSGSPSSRFPADPNVCTRIASIAVPVAVDMTRKSGMPACRRKSSSESC